MSAATDLLIIRGRLAMRAAKIFVINYTALAAQMGTRFLFFFIDHIGLSF